jgi:hypothetical protein
MKPVKPTRKRIYISNAIQGRLMLRIGIYWGLYHIVLWHAIFLYRYTEYRVAASMAGAVSFGAMYGQFVLDYYPLAVCALAALPVVLIDMLQLTHRIAGPLHRCTIALRDLRSGKPVRPFGLRKGDWLTEFHSELNGYLMLLEDDRELALASGSTRQTGVPARMNDDQARIIAGLLEARQVPSAVLVNGGHVPSTDTQRHAGLAVPESTGAADVRCGVGSDPC